jgi:hypothetical protein
MDRVAYTSIGCSSIMIRPVRFLAFAAAIVSASTLDPAWNAHGQETQKRRARPPKFDPREVEQIFFTDARKALVGERPPNLPAKNARPSNSDSGATPPTGTETPPVPGNAFRWSQLISPETLADEVKSYPPLLAAVVKTPSQFQGKGAREARRYFSTMAALFAIITEYDGNVRWKSQAGAARELFARAGLNSKSDNENVYN